jgi:hypothetical protein
MALMRPARTDSNLERSKWLAQASMSLLSDGHAAIITICRRMPGYLYRSRQQRTVRSGFPFAQIGYIDGQSASALFITNMSSDPVKNLAALCYTT